MKKETINKIVKNAENGTRTIIGRYTYKADLNTGEIMRCKTEDLGREWLDDMGRVFSAWETVCNIVNEIPLNEWGSAQSIRAYNRMPEKYRAMIERG